MSWKGIFTRAGIESDGSNIQIQRGNLSVQNPIISKGVTPAEIVTAGPATFTIAQLLTGLILRDPTGASRADLVPTAALIIAGMKNVFIGSVFEFTIVNNGSNGEIVTVTTAAGITLSGTMTIDGGDLRRFRVEVKGVTTPAVTIYDVGGDSDLSAAELEYLDGATPGTTIANKAVIANDDVNVGVIKSTVLHLGATGSEIQQEAALGIPTLTQVDDSALYNVGRRYTNPNGDVYVYAQGVASVILGSVVVLMPTTTGLSATTLILGDAIGAVGVAMAAVVNAKFGWFQIAGLNLATQCDTSATAPAAAYIGGTTGGVDHTVVVGDLVSGMFITVSDSSNLCGVYMSFPHVTNESN